MSKHDTEKTVDWALCLQLCHNKPELAQELLTMFQAELPHFKQSIAQALMQKDIKTLRAQIHKLHGACCYCGVPRLKKLLDNIDTLEADEKKSLLPTFVPRILQEIDDIIETLKTFKSAAS